MRDTFLSLGLIVLAGIVFRRLRVGGLDATDIRQAINTCVLNLFAPALCLKIFYNSRLDFEAVLVPIVSSVTILLTLAVSFLVYRVLDRRLRISPSERGVLIIGSAFGNTTFLGLPVISETFGQGAAKYALYYDLFSTTPLLWLVAAQIASIYGTGKRVSLAQSLKTIALLPPLWGIAGGVVLKAANVTPPTFVLKSVTMLGDLVVPLMIFSIGLAITLPKIKHAWAIVPAAVIKLAAGPVIAFKLAEGIGLDGVAMNSCIVEAGMPTMVVSMLIAARYDLDVTLCAFLIVVTTAISFTTLPFVISML
ncbi:auxin efflux carrier family protein [Candidatus Magnetobacterium bavaricum]|uniref:Auxin efflux carrier family protein n=1 Tax=Candidatus Magnetobacterium bavaricum TaxID=29290 RepID=A0A0F3GSK7_9BACT|nr:auxin efflux carrier family protein [Candidatus Magnetobacterium bavaricum]